MYNLTGLTAGYVNVLNTTMNATSVCETTKTRTMSDEMKTKRIVCAIKMPKKRRTKISFRFGACTRLW